MSNRETAIKGFVGGVWAVEEAWMRSAIQVLKGNSLEIPSRADDVALATRQGERPDGTRYTVVQGRTAVIDLYGVVMPRANFFSEWSGGASCELLAKDFQWCLDNHDITDIIFAVHSPGGEVTGVSELSEMIYKARDKKRITAYVSGMGCSAAFWISSACRTVIANPTAILGSIGVMSVYLDDSKNLEQNGLEEIEFISSQSPFKNPDPKSTEGKKRIQARVDSLAEVFISGVARNRGVTAAKVKTNFGQGDVFVGMDAVAAGLADRIGNFGEVLALIAQDFEIADDVLDLTQDSTLAVEISNIGAKTMAEKEKPQAAEKETVTVEKSELDSMRQQLEDLTESNKTMIAANERLEAEKLKSEIATIAKEFQGETAKHEVVLTGLAKALGKDSPEFKAYVETQTALSAQLEASGLFDTVGKDKGGEGKSALEQLNEKAEAIAKAKGIAVSDAFLEAAEANQELYTAYNKERQAAKEASE